MTGRTDQRRPLSHLPPADRLTVRFHGERSGSAELTWAQRHIWDACQVVADQAYFNLHRIVAPTVTHDAADVARAVRQLVERYETFRTTIGRTPDGHPRQEVAAVGEIAIDVHEIGVGGDVDNALEMTISEYRGHCFADDEWPLRVAVVTRGGTVACVLLNTSHMAVDRIGADVACRAFEQLLAGDGANLPPITHQPLDEAEEEGTPAGRRRAERTAAYWRQTLLTVPHTMVTGAAAVPPRDRRRWSPAGLLLSHAVAMAGDILAARHRTSPASVVLAALSAVLSVRTGNDVMPLHVFVSNRFAPHQRDLVGTRVQRGLFAVDLRDATFAAAIERTAKAALRAYRYAHYPPPLVDAVINDVSVQRGLHLDLGIQFHDRTDGAWPGTRDSTSGPDPARIATALAGTRYRRDVVWERHQHLRCELRVHDSQVRLQLATDPRFLSQDDLAIALRGIEAVLVAAVDGDFPLADVPAITGVTPADQHPAIRADGCWISPESVRLLVSGVTGVTAAHIDLTGPPTDHRVVAHVSTDNPHLTPEDVHRACMLRVQSRPGSSTPHHYVIHPANPDVDPTERWWESAPVRSEGPGRAA